MFLTERDGCEGVVKVFDGKQLKPGEVVTAVGKRAEYTDKSGNLKISIEVKAQEGGAVAFDGEPLPEGGTAVTLPRHQAAAGGQKSFLIFFYDRVLTKMKLKYTDEQNAASATHSVMTAYYRRDINEEELERWLSGPPEEEDIPF